MISVKPTLTAEQVRQYLRESCDKIDANDAGYDESGFSSTHGYGRLSAKRALDLVNGNN